MNDYNRPVIILTPNSEIPSEPELFGVVCSHSSYYSKPWPDDYIEIPHNPRGVGQTKLKKPTVAICNWGTSVHKNIPQEDIGGVVPSRILVQVFQKIEQSRRTK